LYKAQNLEAALAKAGELQRPIVIVFEIPDAQIGGDVCELTGESGDIVFLSVNAKDKDARAVARRYDLEQPGAVMTDEFGNLIASGLETSDDIVDAFYESDELMAEVYGEWSAAVTKGKAHLEKREYSAACRVLQAFAFAAGSDTAEEGRKLFGQVVPLAKREFDDLLAKVSAATEGEPPKALDRKQRDALKKRLVHLITRWPKTPAAFSAEDFLEKLVQKAKREGAR